MNETPKRAVTGGVDPRSASPDMPAVNEKTAVAPAREGAAAAIPIVRHPAANSWYRTPLSRFPRLCPVCEREVTAVWQDHHLGRPYIAGWLFGSWMCSSNVDGQDCSRFVFVHEGDRRRPLAKRLRDDTCCEVMFNCQKTRALRVEEVCQQVLAAKRAIEAKT